MDKIELDENTAAFVLEIVAGIELKKSGGLASAFSSQILAAVPKIVSSGYAKGLCLSVDPDSHLGQNLIKKGLI